MASCEAEYLLDRKHYEYETLDDFKKAFSNFRTQNKQKINALTPFAIGKGSNDVIVYVNNGCYWLSQEIIIYNLCYHLNTIK